MLGIHFITVGTLYNFCRLQKLRSRFPCFGRRAEASSTGIRWHVVYLLQQEMKGRRCKFRLSTTCMRHRHFVLHHKGSEIVFYQTFAPRKRQHVAPLISRADGFWIEKALLMHPQGPQVPSTGYSVEVSSYP